MTDTAFNYYMARGTNAERLAFTPDPATPAAGPDLMVIFYETDTGDLYGWDGAVWVGIATGGGGITQLTGDVTAGPGVGSQAATLATVTVAKGGTGATSLTDHGVLFGSGTGAVTPSAVGTNGQLLRGVTAGDPVWASFRGCLAKLSADQTAANYSTATAVPWDGADVYDTDSIHDPVTNNTRLTVPANILYVRLQGNLLLDLVTANSDCYAVLKKNGSDTFPGNSTPLWDTSSTTPRGVIASAVLPVTGGDYFELFLQVVTDTSITVSGTYSWFSMEIIQ